MAWDRIDSVAPPVGRPVLVRTLEAGEPIVAFLAPDGAWYEGGALVQSASMLLAAVPTEWCEPEGADRL
ncbi:hypothetical protein [Sphingomonas sp.]|uniref:hypothetical protein n=1 Tax=Sphingomonas sp. TaxID=28214 RepID=UPI003AFF935C